MTTKKSGIKKVQAISNEDLLQELKTLQKKDAINNRKSLNLTVTSFIVGILSLIATVIAIGYIEGLRNIEEIHIGMTPFHVNDREDLRNKYESYLRPVNERLRRALNSFLSFRRFVLNVTVSESYDRVFDELSEKGNLQMAFVSHAIFKCKINSIDCTGFEILKDSDNTNKPVKLIGFKKMGNKDHYYSCLIWNKERCNNRDSIPIICKKDSTIIRLGPVLSVSTHIVPEKYLSKQIGIGTSRIKMVDEIYNNVKKNEKIIIGALSDEDYERLSPEQKEMIDTLKIDITIPYDAILVNSEWWRRLGKKQQEKIKNSFINPKNNTNGDVYKYSFGMIDEKDKKFQGFCKKFRNDILVEFDCVSSTKK